LAVRTTARFEPSHCARRCIEWSEAQAWDESLRLLRERDIREVSKVPIGHLDLVGADCIKGWAGLRGQQEPVVVEIYLDQEKVWECLADHPRPDVEEAGLHFERCGFLINDQIVAFGKEARVFAKIRGASGFLGGSGRFLQPVSDASLHSRVTRDTEGRNARKVIGHLDTAADGRIEGWAGIEGRDGPLTVEIYLDHRKLTECVTGQERLGVMEAGKNVGSHSGFSATYETGRTSYHSRVFARVRGSGEFLPGSGRFARRAKGPKLFFVHIPKTGGTTINWIAELLCKRVHTHIESLESAFDDYDFLSAHLAYGAVSMYKERGFRFFTILREPSLQFQSHLQYFGRNAAYEPSADPTIVQIVEALGTAERDPSGQVACLRSLSGERRIRRVINSFFDNCMTRYLASVEIGSTVGPKDVHRAKEVLREFHAIGILSFFPETLKRLSRLTGMPWSEYSSVWQNRGTDALVGSTNQNPASFEEFIWADQEVYQTALELFRKSDVDPFRLAS
jgi:hypothetical protein